MIGDGKQRCGHLLTLFNVSSDMAMSVTRINSLDGVFNKI